MPAKNNYIIIVLLLIVKIPMFQLLIKWTVHVPASLTPHIVLV